MARKRFQVRLLPGRYSHETPDLRLRKQVNRFSTRRPGGGVPPSAPYAGDGEAKPPLHVRAVLSAALQAHIGRFTSTAQ
jgi:hypothetical protein